MNSAWHFPIMIIASFVLFFGVIRIVIGAEEYHAKLRTILWLSLLCVVMGMLFGKYGATWGLPWWIYYPIPMLINVFLPPLILKLNARNVGLYLLLSFLSAPLIHALFSFLFNWKEYMPFWNIPFWGEVLLNGTKNILYRTPSP